MYLFYLKVKITKREETETFHLLIHCLELASPTLGDKRFLQVSQIGARVQGLEPFSIASLGH